VGAIALAGLAGGVGIGVIPLPGAPSSAQGAQSGVQASLAAKRMAANQQWASDTCTNILDWKNEIQRDATSLNFGLGILTRIQDAIAATNRMSNELTKLGLPPAAQAGQLRGEIDQLRSDIESRVHNVQAAANSVATGNFAAIGTLVGDLASDTALGTPIVNDLRHIVSVDLGLSLVETRACRQLVGIPI
jgi:hypothetical protein